MQMQLDCLLLPHFNKNDSANFAKLAQKYWLKGGSTFIGAKTDLYSEYRHQLGLESLLI